MRFKNRPAYCETCGKRKFIQGMSYDLAPYLCKCKK